MTVQNLLELSHINFPEFRVWVPGKSLLHVVSFCAGEPHIDGEPGDLRFRIKVLK